ncbi:hypothetical protein LCGC14_0812930 [marine sediment metagenome]|uniref:DUF559 domain-containing protein n=1 Tax=marine sediment metagenome TaxID=412755 RepID=A0A0F9STH8_9ZZZZ
MLKTESGDYKGYIADFYLPDFQLIIEIDGQSHEGTRNYDQIRDKAFCREKQLRTLRITNQQTKDKKTCNSILRFALKDKLKQFTPRGKVKAKQPKPSLLHFETRAWDRMPMKHVKETAPVVKLRKKK